MSVLRRVRHREWARSLGRRLPESTRRYLLLREQGSVRVGGVRLGTLRRTTPLSREFGFDRGTPIDRYYIEDFLKRHGDFGAYGTGDIRGAVLEVGDSMYARRYGRWNPEGPSTQSVSSLDVLHYSDVNPEATVIGDLESGRGIPTEAYDCIICTQTLHVLYDVHAAVRHLHAALRPGGVLLATVAGLSQTCRPDRDLWGDYWRFTSLSARRVAEEVFPADGVRVETYGNVLAATAFLHGMATEELRRDQLDLRDPDFELLITIRAQKAR